MNETRELIRELQAAQNIDAGWGYYPGKASRLEPTAWALLALASAETEEARSPPTSSVVRLLRSWQRPDGLLADTGGPPNLMFNGLLGLALSAPRWKREPSAEDCLGRLHRGLVAVHGLPLPRSPFQTQNNALRGWPWTEGTASWVEPTAWCLLALKRLARRFPHPFAPARIREAETLLLDRSCAGGGWNYGNSNVLGQELQPYVATTASTLLALRDRPGLPAVAAGLTFLRQAWGREQSGSALSLTTICFGSFGIEADDVVAALERHYRDTKFTGNICWQGMACYALSRTAGMAGVLEP